MRPDTDLQRKLGEAGRVGIDAAAGDEADSAGTPHRSAGWRWTDHALVIVGPLAQQPAAQPEGGGGTP